ncbi:MAG TPA: hypothetical protein VJ785_00480 [Anaerolineales bacterium]|nr:hypothetical protein [Anaerolineales bacterium]
MQNRTLGIVITVVTAFLCICAALFSCGWGGLIATGTPIDVTTNGVTTPQTLPPTVGYVLLCLSVLFILVPVGVGLFALRKQSPTQ